MYKTSFYNFMIPVPEVKKYLFYNTLSNALVETGWDQGLSLSRVLDSVNLSDDAMKAVDGTVRDTIVRNGFVRDIDVDEKQILYDRALRQEKSIYENGTFFITICTTNLCNMNCLYCYEGGKNKLVSENKFLEDKTTDHIMEFLNRETESPVAGKMARLHVNWFGGEPLLLPKVIEKLSTQLLDFACKHGIEYSSQMITNGTLLSGKIWKTLMDAKIFKVQVTIDGDRESHDRNRPLRGKGRSSYDLILKNLELMPEGFHLTIRTTTDRNTLDRIENLLLDLDTKGIWPHRAKDVRLTLGRKICDAASGGDNPSVCLTPAEFVELKEKWRHLVFDYYNRWAVKNAKPQAKLAFLYPKVPVNACGTASYPYGFLLDDAGYIHRCLYDANDKSTRIQHISEAYDISRTEHQKWINFDRLAVDECKACKYLPICEIACPRQPIGGNYECSEWKFTLEDRIKKQYLMLLSDPSKIRMPKEIGRVAA